MELKCSFCDDHISKGSYLTFSNGINLHNDHFNCYTCKEPLEGKKFYKVDDRLNCELCLKKATKTDICCKCDEAICGTMITYNKRKYHKEHFFCDGCDCLLSIDDPVLQCNKNTLCTKCSDTKNNQCFSCKAKFVGRY